jgi:N-acetylmuramoyl-L-alanine amidase
MALVFLLLTSFHPQAPRYAIHRVVIDAGHGGKDSGCLGSKVKEKDVALGVALQLGRYIESHFPEVKVIYTRSTDVFVELHERAAIANNAKADLFICIHCNSACYFDRKKKKELCNEETEGTETWVMGLNKTEANLEVSKRENSVVLLEKDYLKQYDGFDPNSPEANIIFSLYQDAYLDQSLRLASLVQQEVKRQGRQSRGVKQAGFIVLFKTTMPSILVETGFLSNPSEEKYLGSERGQRDMAEAIFNAFKRYKSSVESGSDAGDVRMVEPEDTGKTEKPEKADEEKAPVAESDRPETAPTRQESASPSVSSITFSVQFAISPTRLSPSSPKLRKAGEWREEKDGKLFKYVTGRFRDPADALDLQNALRAKGYTDCFVVAYEGEKRIPYKEAKARMR